ncbi:hypothetical protein [Streptomyces sp. f150]|uniref:hypothetical protein n=1 Tax=Streptomyces sp. f150 TaxID=1827699 RepID=UPI000BF1FD0A|nr:hypothetical protein [Streptomyces sp. f150]
MSTAETVPPISWIARELDLRPGTLHAAPDPTTAVDGADLSTDSFALDEVGCALLSALQDWARDSPVTAAPGIARSIIRVTVNVIPDPEQPDTADTLEAMCVEHLVLAHSAHATVHSVGVLRRA